MEFKEGHTYTVYGEKIGRIWWPNDVDFTKEFQVTFATEQRPFTRQADNLEDALDHILNDGDF